MEALVFPAPAAQVGAAVELGRGRLTRRCQIGRLPGLPVRVAYVGGLTADREPVVRDDARDAGVPGGLAIG